MTYKIIWVALTILSIFMFCSHLKSLIEGIWICILQLHILFSWKKPTLTKIWTLFVINRRLQRCASTTLSNAWLFLMDTGIFGLSFSPPLLRRQMLSDFTHQHLLNCSLSYWWLWPWKRRDSHVTLKWRILNVSLNQNYPPTANSY